MRLIMIDIIRFCTCCCIPFSISLTPPITIFFNCMKLREIKCNSFYFSIFFPILDILANFGIFFSHRFSHSYLSDIWLSGPQEYRLMTSGFTVSFTHSTLFYRKNSRNGKRLWMGQNMKKNHSNPGSKNKRFKPVDTDYEVLWSGREDLNLRLLCLPTAVKVRNKLKNLRLKLKSS